MFIRYSTLFSFLRYSLRTRGKQAQDSQEAGKEPPAESSEPPAASGNSGQSGAGAGGSGGNDGDDDKVNVILQTYYEEKMLTSIFFQAPKKTHTASRSTSETRDLTDSEADETGDPSVNEQQLQAEVHIVIRTY